MKEEEEEDEDEDGHENEDKGQVWWTCGEGVREADSLMRLWNGRCQFKVGLSLGSKDANTGLAFGRVFPGYSLCVLWVHK